MTELFPPGDENTVEKSYYDMKVEEIRTGAPVWMLRNFDDHAGGVIDFFEGGSHRGLVDDEGDGNFRVYHYIGGTDVTEDGLIAIGDTTDLASAKSLLEGVVTFQKEN